MSQSAPPPSSSIPVPPAGQVLKTLRKAHPRLLATQEDFAALKKRVGTDPLLQQWQGKLREQARQILSEPPSKYEIPDGLRLLSVSRRVVGRVQTLGLLYQLDGDERYAQRAWVELEAAAKFQDWNPRHFLDTAEMTHAFAIGYDWLYHAWTSEQRAMLRAAMVEKGLNPALGVYRGTAKTSRWPEMHHNWNQVCNGGIGLGALAIAEEEPALAGEILSAGLKSIQLAMVHFAPDGAWAEGPGYWNYATTYNCDYLAGLETALGSDFGLSDIPGFSECGLFPIYATGPTGRTFNYADAGDGAIHAPHMFWLARRFHRPEYADYELKLASPQPLDLIWYDAKLTEQPAKAPQSPSKYFRGAEVAMLRSGWGRDALFVGLKAGDNRANHSHLDLGSFVLEASGVRWAVDPGADDYNMPGYFGGQRWTYYRLRAEGHNTLVLNPSATPDQDPKAAAKIIAFEDRPARTFAVADLTPAYATAAQRVTRGVALLNGERVLVQDEIEAEHPADLWWFLHTRAQVSLDGAVATLTEGAVRLRAQILSPPNAVFTTTAAEPLPGSPHPPQQNENRGLRKLAIHIPDAKALRLAVLLTPWPAEQKPVSPALQLTPLAQWNTRRND